MLIKNLIYKIWDYLFFLSNETFLMFNANENGSSLIFQIFSDKTQRKLKKYFLSFFIKHMLPTINIIWDWLDDTNWNKFIIAYLIYLFFFLCWFFFYTIKKLYYLYYYYLFINGYYAIALKTHVLFYLVNPRGFFNYKYLMRKRSSDREVNTLKENYLVTLDTFEAKQIYARMREYITLLRFRLDDNTYYLEEGSLLDIQFTMSFDIFKNLKMFYRTSGYRQAPWMRRYHFTEKYNVYWEACYHIDKLKCESQIIALPLKEKLDEFINNLRILVIDKNVNALLLDDYLITNFNFSIDDLYLNKDNFISLDIIIKLKTSAAFLNLNSTIWNSAKFLEIEKIAWELSEMLDSIFLCEVIIKNYINGVDTLIKAEFNGVAQENLAILIQHHKGSIKFAQEEANRNYKINLYIWTPLKNFQNKFNFIMVSFIVKILKYILTNIINYCNKTPSRQKQLKLFKKNYKKIINLRFQDIKPMLMAWWDRDL